MCLRLLAHYRLSHLTSCLELDHVSDAIWVEHNKDRTCARHLKIELPGGFSFSTGGVLLLVGRTCSAGCCF